MKTDLIRALIFSAAAISMSASDPFAAAFEEGKPSLNIRTRYEDVSQTGLKDATAITLRARLGYTTGKVNGWQGHIDVEHIVALDSDKYNQAGLNPGGAGRAVIADPEHTELNQAYLRYTHEKTTYTAGRQRFVLDNVRFIGDVGWRQNQQTFDAIVVQDQSVENLKLTYAYLHQINRIFGNDHPAGTWDSASHLINVSNGGLSIGSLTGYAYLLDFDNAAANSTATYGISLDGNRTLTDELKLSYRAEFAQQSDYGSSPLNYDTEYYVISAGLSGAPGSVTLTHETLGSDNGVGFKTPLATLHAFNGWADQFLGTPGDGLRDTSIKFAPKLPSKIGFTAVYHHYETVRSTRDLGREWDVVLARPFTPQIKGLIKFADFRSDHSSKPDVRKVWVQVDVNL